MCNPANISSRMHYNNITIYLIAIWCACNQVKMFSPKVLFRFQHCSVHHVIFLQYIASYYFLLKNTNINQYLTLYNISNNNEINNSICFTKKVQNICLKKKIPIHSIIHLTEHQMELKIRQMLEPFFW